MAFGGGKTKPKKYRLFLFEDVLLMTETIERIARLPQYKFILEVKVYYALIIVIFLHL